MYLSLCLNDRQCFEARIAARVEPGLSVLPRIRDCFAGVLSLAAGAVPSGDDPVRNDGLSGTAVHCAVLLVGFPGAGGSHHGEV